MKQFSLCLLSFIAIGVFAVSFVSAQDARVASAVGEMYVVSAKAGGVNYAEGKVAVARKDAKSGWLIKGDNVEIGDRVITGENGKAEILLNPGSFLRLDKNSSFQFVSTDLDNLKLVLSQGSAILEVFADEDYKVTVRTPKAAFYLIESGVYRINVLADGTEQIEVWKGRAQIGDGKATIIKAGKTASIANGQLALAKFDRDEKDEFDQWSKLRAKYLARINSKLQKNLLRDSLLNSYNQRGWNMYNSFGVWVFNRAFGSFCFVPFGYGWSSPYGYGFGYDFWDYRFPRHVYYPPTYGTNNGNGNTNNNPGGTVNPPASLNPSNQERTRRITEPPFQRMRGAGTGMMNTDSDFDVSSPSRNSSPSRTSAPSSVPSAPPPSAPTRSAGKADRDN